MVHGANTISAVPINMTVRRLAPGVGACGHEWIMKPKKEPAKPKDDMQQKLQESLRKRRPRILPVLLIVSGLVIGILGLLVFLLYPRPELPRLQVVAFDQLAAVGGEVQLHGRLEMPSGETRNTSLANLEMIFEDGGLRNIAGQKLERVTVRTKSDGSASCPWRFPEGFLQGEFVARRIGTTTSPGTHDRGRVVLLPKESRLVLVHVDRTLAAVPDDAWEERNILDIPAAPGAAETLAALERSKYRVIYLAMNAEKPSLYQKMRGWVKNQGSAGPKRFPMGPVLSRLASGKQGVDSRQQTAAVLKEQFTGAHLAIVGTVSAARELHAAGYLVYYLGQKGDAPAGVEQARDWAELSGLIGK